MEVFSGFLNLIVMQDIVEKEFALAIISLQKDNQLIRLELGKVEAWSLLSSVQLAARYPINSLTVKCAVEVMKRHKNVITQRNRVVEKMFWAGWKNRLPPCTQSIAKTAFESISNDINFVISKYEAFCLVSSVQLACRHPQYKKRQLASVSETIAKTLQNTIAPQGILAAVLEAGWDESLDYSLNVVESNLESQA